MSAVETVTVLFTDLVDSTGLLSRLGHDAYERVRQDHFAAVRRTIAENGGREVKNVGDGFMVAFNSTGAAVGCAVAIQQGNSTARDAPGVRVGISIGEASREDGDYFGVPVVEAARLCAAAAGGQILVSETVQVLTGSRGGHVERVPNC